VAGPTTCFSDAGGTVPCAVGDSCYIFKSTFGPLRTFTQATSGARLILRQTTAGKYYLEGAAGRIMNSDFLAQTSNNATVLVMAVRPGNANLPLGAYASPSAGGFIAIGQNGVLGIIDSQGSRLSYTGMTATTSLQSLIVQKPAGDSTTPPTIYRDGTAFTTTTGGPYSAVGQADARAYLNTNSSGTAGGASNFYGFGIANNLAMSASEIASLNTYQQGLYAATPVLWADSTPVLWADSTPLLWSPY
jgi:hypothetical protein